MLVRTNLLLVALLIVHTVDHAINQPARDLPATGTLIGVAGFAIVAGSTVLALSRHQLAAPAAVFAGLATALGIVGVHLAPGWYHPISDPYWDFDPNLISWALALAPLIGGLALAAIGARELRSGWTAAQPSG